MMHNRSDLVQMVRYFFLITRFPAKNISEAYSILLISAAEDGLNSVVISILYLG